MQVEHVGLEPENVQVSHKGLPHDSHCNPVLSGEVPEGHYLMHDPL